MISERSERVRLPVRYSDVDQLDLLPDRKRQGDVSFLYLQLVKMVWLFNITRNLRPGLIEYYINHSSR